MKGNFPDLEAQPQGDLLGLHLDSARLGWGGGWRGGEGAQGRDCLWDGSRAGAFSSWDSWEALVLTVYRIGEKGVVLPRARNLMSRLHFPLRSNFIRSPSLFLIISPHHFFLRFC